MVTAHSGECNRKQQSYKNHLNSVIVAGSELKGSTKIACVSVAHDDEQLALNVHLLSNNLPDIRNQKTIFCSFIYFSPFLVYFFVCDSAKLYFLTAVKSTVYMST